MQAVTITIVGVTAQTPLLLKLTVTTSLNWTTKPVVIPVKYEYWKMIASTVGARGTGLETKDRKSKIIIIRYVMHT